MFHSNPVAFLQRWNNDRQFRRAMWTRGALAVLITVVVLVTTAAVTHRQWTLLLANALLPVVLVMAGISLAVTLTGHAQVWMRVVCDPLTMVVALLAGLDFLGVVVEVLAWAVGVPLLLGLLLSVVCAVWVENRVQANMHERQRRRTTAIRVDLPALVLQRRVRLVRLIAAGSCLLLAGVALFILLPSEPTTGALVALALVVAAAGCVRIEATVMSWIAGFPLVVQDAQGNWHAAYCGRWALLAPPSQIVPLMTLELAHAQVGAPILALLQAGALQPSMQQACNRLSIQQAHALALGLSLQSGGASAIRLFAPAFPSMAQENALTYARLAQEAAQPPNLQRWLAALGAETNMVAMGQANLIAELNTTLANAKDVLLSFTYRSSFEAVPNRLHTIVTTLFPHRMMIEGWNNQPHAWPEALLQRVVNHLHMLRSQTAENSSQP